MRKAVGKSEHEGVSDENWDTMVLLSSVCEELNERRAEFDKALMELNSPSEYVNGYRSGLTEGLKMASELVAVVGARAEKGEHYWTKKPVYSEQ
jgi:hypothetical protein